MFNLRDTYNGDTYEGQPIEGGYYTGYKGITFPTTDPDTQLPITADRAAELSVPMTFTSYAAKRSATYLGNDTFYDNDKSTMIGGTDPRVDMSGFDFLIKST